MTHETDLVRRTREMLIDGRYLLLPISETREATRVHVEIGREFATSFRAKLGYPGDWWAHVDVGAWRSRKILIEFEDAAGDGADAITVSEDIWDSANLYRESTRPFFHFTARRGWLNDPNGLVYHQGKFHLFFQHNPYGLQWGNMHWGHAISDDLVHWEEVGVALRPTGEDDFAFSGSAVIDTENTSGWGTDSLVVAFTSTGRGECIAYSLDGGMSFSEYEHNPVVRHDRHGRDPRLVWHEPTAAWIMAVYEGRTGEDGETVGAIAFFRSRDLKTWEPTSWIPGFYECPDLFQLSVDDDETDRRWVLTAAPGDYLLGDFDGFAFEPTSERLPAPTGESAATTILYAAQTFTDHPEGKRVQMAWGKVDDDGAPHSQLMLVPTVLSLRTTVDGVRLCRKPIDALRSLRINSHRVADVPITDDSWLLNLSAAAWDIEMRVTVGSFSRIQLQIGTDTYTYLTSSQTLIGPRGAMQIPIVGGDIFARILVDRTTVEIFGDRGQAYGIFTRTDPGHDATLSIRGGGIEQPRIVELLAHELESSWHTSHA